MNAGRSLKVFQLYFPPAQMSEVEGKASCNSMSNSVADWLRRKLAPMLPRALRRRPASPDRQHSNVGLYAPDGARKYLNQVERQRFLAAIAALGADDALFCLTLAWTGARVSEVLALTPSSFQVERGIVALRTLKRRRHHAREVPIPPELMAALDRRFGLSSERRDPRGADHRLWPWHRVTAWRVIKRVMQNSGVEGRQATPRGLRHAFGVGSLQAGVPLNLVQRWLGHARISTTAIYAAVCGPEEIVFAAAFWRSGDARTLPSHSDHTAPAI
jgi:integrase/recombinase XerD